LDDTTAASAGAGAAARDAGAEAAAGADQAATGWGAVTAALAEYASKARDIGGNVSRALGGAFSFAENAIGDFVKTGKIDFRDMVTSMIADLAKLAAQRFILGLIANALSGALGGAGRIFANILHAGGMVGAPGPGRMGPRLGLCRCPPMHTGGWAGLRPDEVPAAILQRGERVLSRREAAGYGQSAASTVTSRSTRAMPKASASPARRSPATSPAPCRWAGGGCDPHSAQQHPDRDCGQHHPK
jgi:hypothetical protein